ncbi:hypothetical protein RKE29_13785 [Streptomyces sp. B1866]|uniref:phosphatase PAP2 family protein n=1 Tax=Streptomyces sp. B1866 TaxID=3075431 RepID=UPI00288F9321|nr:hypothetical protein [Streptomyces sp. B1866]MDT3397707.1 hypothetical protein [Streptomyces sp. B1866]
MTTDTTGTAEATGGAAAVGRAPARRRVARLVTDGLEPKNWIVPLTLAVGWRADGAAGAGWGLYATVFAAVLPVLFIRFGVRRGRWADRHVGVRRQRLAVLVFVVCSVAAGTLSMALLGAPPEMVALVAAMAATLVVLMAITVAWKVSVHAAVSCGSVVILAFAYGPWALACAPLTAMVGWSRVALRDHTPAQVVAGAALGAAVAGAVFALAR